MIVMSCGIAFAAADVQLTDDTVLVKRGPAVITFRDFKAELAQMPANIRNGVANDPQRLSTLLSNLVKQRLIAEQAREAGLGSDPDIKAALALAEDKVLSEAQMDKMVREGRDADYEAMAREYYLAHPDEFQVPEHIDVSQILVSSEDRTDEQARKRAEEALHKLRSGEASFEDLVKQYSDDPSAKDNHGHFRGVKRGKFVKPFENAAFGLDKPGDVTGPVKTRFGYHIIRLDGKTAAGRQPFEEAREDLVKRMKDKQQDRIRGQYIDRLIDQNPLEADEATIQALRDQYRNHIPAELKQ